MKNFATRLMVAIITFGLGLGTGTFFSRPPRSVSQSAPAIQIAQELPREVSPPLAPATQDELPDNLSPSNLERFINANPEANLSGLWRRLGISDKPDGFDFPDDCSDCKVESFEYDLDDEPGDEVLLRVSNSLAEAYRYLVFKMSDTERDRWRLLGHSDVWGKYQEPKHMVLLSGGKVWLLIQGQGASGSGIALYIADLFQVTRNHMKKIASYSAEAFQSGQSDGPTRETYGRVLSCDINHGRATVSIGFTVEYSFQDKRGDYLPLFSKRQQAVLDRKPGSKETVLDRKRSSLSSDELAAVYNIDSLSYEDFLRYNHSQLAEIALGSDSTKKSWLSGFLKLCENTAEKRRLSKLLAPN